MSYPDMPMARPLKLHLFGPPRLDRGDGMLASLPTQNSASLLGYLALHHGRWHSRESLATLLWGEYSEASARKRLRGELWRIRRMLAASQNSLTANRNLVLFHPGEIWIDVVCFIDFSDDFRKWRGREIDEDKLHRLKKAVELYRGDLLEGCFDSWCLSPREHLRGSFIAALQCLLSYHLDRHEWEDAIACGQRILEHDPLLEQVHRELMLSFHQLGNRSAALRQFFQCAELLKEELDVEPMPATLQLYQNIKDNLAVSPVRSEGEHQSPEPAPDSPSGLLDKLHDLRQQVSELHSQIARMIKDLGPSVLLFSSLFISCSMP
jgi:DNA-binding SARP family transcriptional activator